MESEWKKIHFTVTSDAMEKRWMYRLYRVGKGVFHDGLCSNGMAVDASVVMR